MALKNNNGGDDTIYPNNRYSGDIKTGIDAGVGYSSTDQVVGDTRSEGNSLRYVAGNEGVGGTYTGVYANGSPLAPTYVNQGDILTRFVGGGADETGDLANDSLGIIQMKVWDTDPVGGGGTGGFFSQWETSFGFVVKHRVFYNGDILIGDGANWEAPTILDYAPTHVIRGGAPAYVMANTLVDRAWVMASTAGPLVFRVEDISGATAQVWLTVDEDTAEITPLLPTSAGTTGSLWNDGGTVKVSP